MRKAGLTVVLIALSGCGGADTAAPAAEAEAPQIDVVNTYQQKLEALPERDRNLALRRAVQDDGGACRSIEAAAYQQEHLKLAMWVVRCSTYDYAVYVGASGQVQARRCDQAQGLGLPACTALGPRPPRKAA